MMTWPSVTASTVLSVLSFIIAMGSFLYTMRTYAVTHRPYVGVVSHDYRVLGDPPTAMVWRFVLKNVGGLPAWVAVEENQAFVTTDGQRSALPILGRSPGGIYLMPGQTADLGGQFSDAGGLARVSEVFSGRTELEARIRLAYEASALWWRNRYYYRVANTFRVHPLPAAFTMTEATAN